MAKNRLGKSSAFYDIYERNPSSDKTVTHYCPGCGHGILHKFIAEALEDYGVWNRTILLSPVGCSVFAYYYFKVGNIQCAHGRAPAVATGIKRAHPDSIVISYQGDGDLAGIGGNEIIQAANRGENITVFFINNAIYGMTGGQMAPTTLVGQSTTTTPRGRDIYNEGYPIKIAEIISILESPVYVERVALADTKNIMKARSAVRKAINYQVENKGFSLVEVLSPCPTGWKMNPVDAKKWVTNEMQKYFKLGVFKDVGKERKSRKVNGEKVPLNKVPDIIDIPSDEKKEISRIEKKSEEKFLKRIKIAGFGGQGILLLGVTLAESGMMEGKNVTWLPSYGPEMRGGTANCHVIVSNQRIGSPLVDWSDILIAMNRPSLDKFEPKAVPGSLIFYDSTIVNRKPERNDVKAIGVPFTEIADGIGSTKVLNMVALGSLIRFTGMLSPETLFEAQTRVVKRKEFLELNKRAIKAGMEFIDSLKES
ncbi:2-ketoisovalerate ferredoxin oxidoreductase [candidate division KSB1 bacterium]|nr:MAG: 2-ketoisovalerate ferredoxin oxidoreductase [candidate division KSB1 bacterium]